MAFRVSNYSKLKKKIAEQTRFNSESDIYGAPLLLQGLTFAVESIN